MDSDVDPSGRPQQKKQAQDDDRHSTGFSSGKFFLSFHSYLLDQWSFPLRPFPLRGVDQGSFKFSPHSTNGATLSEFNLSGSLIVTSSLSLLPLPAWTRTTMHHSQRAQHWHASCPEQERRRWRIFLPRHQVFLCCCFYCHRFTTRRGGEHAIVVDGDVG